MNHSSNLYQELSDSEINKIVGTCFGNQSVFTYNLLSGGLFNTTYLISFQTGKKVVLRVGPVNRHLLLPFEENLMKAEQYVYSLCSEYKIPTPNVILCDTSKALLDRDYMLTDYIPSESLSSVTADPEVKDELYRQTGFYTAQLHQISGKHFGRVSQVISGNGFDQWSDCIKNEIKEWKSKAIDTDIFSESNYQSIEKIIDQYTALLDNIQVPALVHADLWAGNVLVSSQNNQTSVAAIIDADRAIFGDIDFEFASGWMINESFIKGYSKGLNMNNGNVIRRQIYQLIFNLLDAYVWQAQYNNADNSNKNKKRALELIDNLK